MTRILFTWNLSNKHGKQLLDTWLDALITASKKLAHKAAEATRKSVGKKITDNKERNFSTRKGRINIEWIEKMEQILWQ